MNDKFILGNIYMYTYQKNSIQENLPCDVKTLNTNIQNKA